jgi:calcium-dependent protein kinase
MHKKGICHRDLKPENFLFLTQDPLERNVLKIIDFGVSCVFETNVELRDKAGTPFYTAPQVLDGRYTEACDLWSCGVIMYILLCGVPPFMGKTDVEVCQKIKRGNFAFQADAWKKVSEDTKNLIRGLLQYQPNKRFNATEALNHIAIHQRAPRGKDVNLRPSIIGSMRSFAFSPKLKKAALHAVATTSREDQVASLREIFLALDMDDDGFVTFNELQSAFEQAGLTVPADLEAIVEEVDANRSGAIDYTEFLAATLEEAHYLQKDRCWAAFLVFDRNGDGKISKEELEVTLGDPVPGRDEDTREAIVDVLQASDLNGDGFLDFSEFMHMMSAKHNSNGRNGSATRIEPRTP